MNLIEQPEIDFLILADRAEAVNGKLYMMGGAWDRLAVADFSQPIQFNLAIGVLVPWSRTNEEHPLVAYVEDEDGNRVTSDIRVGVNVGRPPLAVKGQAFRALIVVNGMWKLPGPGTYRVLASLSDQQPKRVVFHAMPSRQAA